MRKMVLIPYDQFIRSNHSPYNQQQQQQQDYQDGQQAQEPGGLPSVFQSKDTEHIFHPTTNQNHIKQQDSLDTIKSPENNRLNESVILQPFGKNQYRNAECILNYIKQQLDWNQDGELLINGTVISNSHITDLIKDSLSVHTKKWSPIGYFEFYSNLGNLPLSLIRNKERHPLIGRGKRSSSHLPPPGVPVNKKPLLLEESETEKEKSDQEWIKNWKQI